MYNNVKIQNTRILNNILGFWGSIFSNFHINSFKYENIWFPSGVRQRIEVHEGLVRCINAKRYEVDEDYDFGSIHPDDLIIELYTTGRKSCPGIKEVEYASSHN